MTRITINYTLNQSLTSTLQQHDRPKRPLFYNVLYTFKQKFNDSNINTKSHKIN